MAVSIGVANNHLHLVEIVRDFLKSDPDLVAAGQNWTQLVGPTGPITSADASADFHITMRGPGLSNEDEVLVSFYTTEDNITENWRFSVYCHGGFVPGNPVTDHPVTSPITRVPTWNQPMPYWLVADGRSFGLVCQVSTVFTSGTWGLGLPNVLKKNYPKPFIAAGCAGSTGSWTTTHGQYRFLANPGWNCMFALWPDNVWRTVANYNTGNNGDNIGAGPGYVYPSLNSVTNSSHGGGFDLGSSMFNANAAWMPTVKGDYVPRRLRVKSRDPYVSNLFYIDKFLTVSGRQGISSGNILTLAGDDYLVVQNWHRTAFNDYMLMRLA